MELMKSMPYTLAAYIVIATVLIGYFGTILARFRKVDIESEHLDSLDEMSANDPSKSE